VFRRKDLCPGALVCPEAMNLNGPEAGPDALPCPECPEQYLDTYLASPAGQLVAMVCQLDFALQAGVAVSLAEIPYPEFLLLRQLVEEREAYQAEEMKKKR